MSPSWHSPVIPKTEVPQWVREMTAYEPYVAHVRPPGCVNVMVDLRPLSQNEPAVATPTREYLVEDRPVVPQVSTPTGGTHPSNSESKTKKVLI